MAEARHVTAALDPTPGRRRHRALCGGGRGVGAAARTGNGRRAHEWQTIHLSGGYTVANGDHLARADAGEAERARSVDTGYRAAIALRGAARAGADRVGKPRSRYVVTARLAHPATGTYAAERRANRDPLT
jgi:hypothetical protein